VTERKTVKATHKGIVGAPLNRGIEIRKKTKKLIKPEKPEKK